MWSIPVIIHRVLKEILPRQLFSYGNDIEGLKAIRSRANHEIIMIIYLIRSFPLSSSHSKNMQPVVKGITMSFHPVRVLRLSFSY